MDFKIFLLHKDNMILEDLEIWMNTIDTDFGVTVDISTFEPDDIPFMNNLINDEDLFEGYGLIILNTNNKDFQEILSAIDCCTSETLILYDPSLIGDYGNRFFPYHSEEQTLNIITKDDVERISNTVRRGKTLTDDLHYEGTVQVVRLRDYSANELNLMRTVEEELPIDTDVSSNATSNSDLKMMLASQVAKFSNKGIEETSEENYQEVEQKKLEDSFEHVVVEEGINNVDSSGESTSYVPIHDKHQVENEPKIEVQQKSKKLEVDEKNKINDGDKGVGNNHIENYYEKSRLIQKNLFAKQQWEGHKSIGLWSPLTRMGVTTFAINFSIFLAENRLYVGVLEGLKDEPILKHWLKRYAQLPKDWTSYAKAIHLAPTDSFNADWTYRNVLYLPLDDDDTELHWDNEKLEVYLSTPTLMDITLIDLPAGEMKDYTYFSLNYIDELWIIVDDTYQEIVAWKNYIHAIQKKFDLKVRLIFNKEYEFSQTSRLSKTLDLEILCQIPSLHKEVMRNYYKNQPLLFSEGVREILFEPYAKLTRYIMGSDFNILTTIDNRKLIPQKENDTYWENFMEKIKRWLKG
ncbi:hypothetical protein [Lysinibacillus fusiformis]|uniref:hypothetical protein n=1 Tax=Lysinibacillus fusiformis TaxID=28031 RepID=UPI003712CF47